MSAPSKFNGIGSIGVEIVSGLSALHMEPKPIENPQGEYLSDTDHWVNHSQVHFNAAIEMTNRVHSAFAEVYRVLESALSPENDLLFHRNINDNMTDVDRLKVLAAIIKRQAQQ